MKMKKIIFLLAGLLFCWGQVLAKYELVVAQPTSNMLCNGTMTATATGNTGPYEFLWTDANGNPENSTDSANSSQINGVCDGIYMVTIINGYGCEIILDASFSTLEVDIKVFLEGSYDLGTGIMLAGLMDRGLLPGQTPTSNLAVPTIAGQPYNNINFNYSGDEGLGWTDSNYEELNNDVVDWVLVSLKSDITSSPLQTRAGLLFTNGEIFFPKPFANTNLPNSVRVAIEHRNHLPIISEVLTVANNLLVKDFTVTDSYHAPTNFGQKELAPNVWSMLAGNASTVSDELDKYDFKGTDKALWFDKNGVFDQYILGDMDLNGDVSGSDKKLWFDNNGKSGMVLEKQ